MATAQGFIQGLAQQNVPSGVNNGNPNTIYNSPLMGAQSPPAGWVPSPLGSGYVPDAMVNKVAPVAAGWTAPNTQYQGADQQASAAAMAQQMEAARQQAAAQGQSNIQQGAAIGAQNRPQITQTTGVVPGGWVAPENTAPTEPLMKLPSGWQDALKDIDVANPGGGTTPTTPTPTTPTPSNIPDLNLDHEWITVNKGVPGKNNEMYANDPLYKQAYDAVASAHKQQFGSDFTNRSDGYAISQDVINRYVNLWNQKYGTNIVYKDPGKGNNSGVVKGADAQFGTVTTGAGGNYTNSMSAQDRQYLSGLINGSSPVIGNSGWAAGTNGNAAAMQSNLGAAITNGLSNLANATSMSGVMSFLDAITEPFMPGNMYMSELGKINMPNVVTALLNKTVPGLGKLASFIADKIPDSAGGILGKIRNFFREGKFKELANEIYKDMDAEEQAELAKQAVEGKPPTPPTGGGLTGGSGGWSNGGGTIGGGWLGGGINVGGGRTGSVTTGEVETVIQ